MKDATHPLSAEGDPEHYPRPARGGEAHPRPPIGLGTLSPAPLPASPPGRTPGAESDPTGPEDAAFVDYLRGVVKRSPWIGLNAFLIGGIAAVVSLFLPHWFLASGSYLPAVEERSTFSITALLREAAIPGAGLSDQVQAGDLSVALLKSRRLRQVLIQEFDLVQRYKVKNVEDALVTLDVHSNYFVGQEGLVTVSIEDRDPAMAARMVNRSIDLLDEFNAEQRMTKGQRTRLFVERELALSEGSLRKSEDDLEHYQAKTKLVPLSAEVESAVSSGSLLLARKMEIEIQLGMRASILQESNEELKLLRLELAEIDRKLGQLPALGVEYARLVRDLKVREAVYGFLRTELEQAKIQEARDTPSLTIVDRADPPLRRTRPRRAAIALTAAGVTAVVSILGALVLTWGELLPPDDRRRHVLGAMRGDLKTLFRRRRRS
jgi:uncharacterized protein involved in exopolysaccharide biosynthesis